MRSKDPACARSSRWKRALPAGALLGAGLLGLGACGTVPPATPTSPTGAPSSLNPATPSVAPSSPGAAPASPTAGPASPTPSPSPTPDVWVGSFHGHSITVPRGHGATMSFTFDDGPWPGSTRQVLALLAQHHVHAVFCLIGQQARAYPTLVHEEVAAGHELCDHSRDHDVLMGRKGQAYVDAEVGDGLRDVVGAAPKGTPVTFYRQPGGTWDTKVVRAMDAHSLGPLRWSDDPKDWSRPGSLAIVRRVVANLHPGAVVLMHDGGGDRSQSVDALRFLLDAVVAAGWKPVLAPHVHLSPKAAAKPQ
ncbi:polysaccharide deacetylase family protein [Microlunatus flavus]|uniref:Peptidoglycan/xylan/chitin deacetylase, PgdA/CDA1 family n=1 Tax=Microlunatus flavus TaxID=1036181 RepID=A0A1H9N0H1_9ACTN|nr:polysaccharide deacetylase family protein [Microlunatus flavus]SER29490.1 Peptidoglycan/xylan/chitin deacetylase, PgdA/CDA1 family [Microlunatus flavus]